MTACAVARHRFVSDKVWQGRGRGGQRERQARISLYTLLTRRSDLSVTNLSSEALFDMKK